jgi:hypothetical protein
LRHVPRFAWLGYWPAGLMASLYRILSKARSGQSCSGKPANSGLRLEGLVSKHGDRAYRAGTSPNWVKVKNPKHPAMTRVMEAFREKRS